MGLFIFAMARFKLLQKVNYTILSYIHFVDNDLFVNGKLKDDFQSVLRCLSTLMFISIIISHPMECKSMLFVTNHIPYLCGLSNSFSNSFIDFYSCEVVSSSDMRKNEA